jgi:hypothetical protein
MRRLVLALMIAAVTLASGAPLRAHEQFRFVGYVTQWDLKKHWLELRTREVWNGRSGEYTRQMYLRPECKVIRLTQEVKRSELKVGLYVVVDASGDEITNVEATEIEIKTLPAPAKKKK